MKFPLRIVGVVLAGIVSAVGVVVAAQPAQALPSTFSIVNYGSNLCLEPLGSGWGEPIVQAPCDPSRSTQRWFLSRATTSRYLIVNAGTGLCMDVRDGRNADGTVVQVWSCNLRAPSMRWALSSLVPDLYYKLVSEIGSRCLDGREAGLQIHSCTPDNVAQIFALQG